VRPYGAEDYDAAMEYGRSGEGVEASISYVIDPTLSDNKLLAVGKHRGRGSDNRVSIRLDREGVLPNQREGHDVKRNPLQYQGTLSLDVGSVIGGDIWLGTKIGRFLAWGNLLRSSGLDQPAQLNHVTRYFDENDGQADIFAGEARSLIKRLESKRIHKEKLTEYLSTLAVA
jgi:hypothetical protein